MSTITKARNLLRRFARDERGAEIPAWLGLIAIVIVGLVLVGAWFSGFLSDATSGMTIPNL